MKKPKSITDICLNIVRIGFFIAIGVAIVKYLITSNSREYMVISGLPQRQSAQTSSLTPDMVFSSPTTASAAPDIPEELPQSAVEGSPQEVSASGYENTTAAGRQSTSQETSAAAEESVPQEKPAETQPAHTPDIPQTTAAETTAVPVISAETTVAVTRAVQTAAAPAAQTAAPAETTVIARPETNGLININTASAAQLMDLKGIGEVKAAAIIRYREENGGFKSIDEILNVKGIGEKTFEKICGQITV